jgi:hypothetical protein
VGGDRTVAGRRAQAGVWCGEEEEANAWGHGVSEVGRLGRYPFGAKRYWAGAALAAGPNTSPRPFTLFFPFSFLFSIFLISELFHEIYKCDSNPIKQISRAFKKSLQCFETVINQVFRINMIFNKIS